MNVSVEKSGREWQVRVWRDDTGYHVWTFRKEVEARRMAMKLHEAIGAGLAQLDCAQRDPA